MKLGVGVMVEQGLQKKMARCDRNPWPRDSPLYSHRLTSHSAHLVVEWKAQLRGKHMHQVLSGSVRFCQVRRSHCGFISGVCEVF